jgi:hypothetical protein
MAFHNFEVLRFCINYKQTKITRTLDTKHKPKDSDLKCKYDHFQEMYLKQAQSLFPSQSVPGHSVLHKGKGLTRVCPLEKLTDPKEREVQHENQKAENVSSLFLFQKALIQGKNHLRTKEDHRVISLMKPNISLVHLYLFPLGGGNAD